jgi:hypothetical protein
MRLVCLVSVLAIPVLVSGQIQDPSAGESPGPGTDTEIVQSDQPGFFVRFKQNWKEPYPNPLRASVFSLVIPGAGQIYNKRYWKAPIVWGGLVGVGYLINHNLEQRDRFEEAYGKRIAGIPGDEFEGIIPNAAGIKRYRDLYEKWLQQSYIGFVAVWVLNSLEAYVDAHLKNFDISDDLSFRVVPSLPDKENNIAGFSVQLTF